MGVSVTVFFNSEPIEMRRSDGEGLRVACREERMSGFLSASSDPVSARVPRARTHRSLSSLQDPPARPPATAGQKTRCPPARRTRSPQTSPQGLCTSTGHRAPSSATTTSGVSSCTRSFTYSLMHSLIHLFSRSFSHARSHAFGWIH